MHLKVLIDRLLSVKIWKDYSTKYLVVNGTPQGSIVSPALFSVIIMTIVIRPFLIHKRQKKKTGSLH